MWIKNWMECWISIQAEVNGNANAKRSNFLILLNWDPFERLTPFVLASAG
jgi:hypothetical protein